ncbi:hypothetical protein WK13_34685 [Burkholderia ubonensis]|uniref:YkgJ family cysteine cluster protein n=1 Tax=Burkholderia ubonensis TaxID=101571 RepID=UPI000756C000|nr:YkgJ family cysteine cluster protein [Burkholderia ubonensis]KVR21687.1 hypothetical protein WK13_34685 [Burkholderia ubonensis]
MTERVITLSPDMQDAVDRAQLEAQRNLGRINLRVAPRKEAFSRALTGIVRSSDPARKKLKRYIRVVDEIMALNAPDTACRAGCSHCCYIAVGVMQTEAELIGKAIGRKPKKVKHRDNFDGFDFGYHNPCTFLKDGRCSIYEHRPLACRMHYSLADTPDLCKLNPPETNPVPMVNTLSLNKGYVQICAPDKPVLADIRDFFPPV